MLNHDKFMKEALRLALRGQGWVSPNPMVGAIVVKNGKITGKGWHRQFGGPHAEIFALKNSGAVSKGATLYCTLEPCAHSGKTPPCVESLIQAGIKTVVLGASDPNPTAGGGAKRLQAAGIEVITGICELECKRLNAHFFKSVMTGLPLVSVKWAMTADGKIATACGDSKWVSSDESRSFGHVLRSQHDAILIGMGTLLADGPLLTCRHATQRNVRQPLRVILDSQARTPLNAPIWSAKNGGPVTIACSASAPASRRKALQKIGADLIICSGIGKGRLPIREVLSALTRRGVLSVLVEGGSNVLGSFVDAGLVDRAYVFIAPKILGGSKSMTAVGGKGVNRIADALALQSVKIQQLGPDILISGMVGSWVWNR